MKLRMRMVEERGKGRPVGTTEREDQDRKRGQRGWLPVVEAVVFGG